MASIIPVQLFHEHKEDHTITTSKPINILQKHEIKCCDVHEEALRFTAIIPHADFLITDYHFASILTPITLNGDIKFITELKNKAPPVFAA